jgi:hypothetical protein
MGGTCGTYGRQQSCIQGLVDRPGGKRPFWKPMPRGEDNIKIDSQIMGCGGMDWSDFSQDRNRWWAFVNAVMKVQVPWNAGNFLTSRRPVSFSRWALLLGVIYLWNTSYSSTLRNDWYVLVTRAVSRRHPAMENQVHVGLALGRWHYGRVFSDYCDFLFQYHSIRAPSHILFMHHQHHINLATDSVFKWNISFPLFLN